MRFGFDLFVAIALAMACIAGLAVGIYDDAWIGVAAFGFVALVLSLVAGKSSGPPSAGSGSRGSGP